MRRFLEPFLILILLSLTTENSKAQTKVQYTCGDDLLKELLRTVEPNYDAIQLKSNLQIRDFNSQTKQYKSSGQVKRTTDESTFTIPVVVHIVYPAGQPYGTGTNISYAQVRSQIEALNAAFSKNYPAYNGQSHPPYASDTRIRFCLSRNISDTSHWAEGPGGTEFGVRRFPVKSGENNHDITQYSATQMLRLTHPTTNSFPFDKYLNIWLVSTIGGGNNIMGYAPRPIMPGYLLDGVVMRADVFGDNTTGGSFKLNYGLAQGKVLAHEVGHYLSLYHIFQGGCAGANPAGSATDGCDLNGDMICDIEPSTTQNIFCTGTIPNTCTANYATGTVTDDMINDYMSYADDDCMNTFTTNQVQRMQATLTLQRSNLWQPANLAATGVIGQGGCVPPYLNAQINLSDGVICAGNQATFSNPLPGNTATAYQWTFAGGLPSSANTNTATITYSQPGNYKVILTVRDGVNVRTDSLQLNVLECKPDSSMLYMSNWYFGNYGSIDFSSGHPIQTKVAFNNKSIHGELAYPTQLQPFIAGTVSISDSMGNLLFYSNGVGVWNKHHKKISRSSIFGVSDINASSGLYYVPFPGHKNKYFITGAYPDFDEKPSGVRFILVDVDADSVYAYIQFSHSSLPNRFSQFLTVVPHCNGIDYWIIVKGFGREDTKFYSFLVTENGIDAAQQPVISSGFVHPGFGGSGNQLKSNRQGNKLVLGSPHGYNGIEAGALYNFDNRTGKVSNEIKIRDVAGYNNIQSGVAFSPNGKYFYLFRSSNLATNGKPYWLFQYKVSDMTYNIINAPGFYVAASMQPGPDNQIYVTTQEHYFAQIASPDEWQKVTVNGYLINMRQPNDEIRTGVSIPNFIDARQPSPAAPDFDISAINCNTFTFSALCFDKYIATWNFGDGSAVQTGSSVQHTFNSAATFKVTLVLSTGATGYGSITKTVDVLPLTVTISGPENICANGNYVNQYFAPILNDVSYSWRVSGGTISGPANLPYVNVAWSPVGNNGSVELQINRQGCWFNDLKTVRIAAGPNFNWSPPDSVCIFDSSITLFASPQAGKFAGPGITGNQFSPMKAGVGSHTITYTYFDEVTCLGQVERTIKVNRCNVPISPNTACDDVLKSVSIAPNPVGNVLRLKSPYALQFVQVFNASGQLAAKGNLVNNMLPLPALASGMYSVLVYCNNNTAYRVLKFVKGS